MDRSPFVEGVRLGYVARLNVAGQRTYLSTDQLLLAVHENEVRIEPALLEGLQQGSSPRVLGNMPESGWALQTNYSERTSRSSLSRWTGSEWVAADGLLQNKYVMSISPWSDGRVLALLGTDYPSRLSFVQLAGARGAPLPQFTGQARKDLDCVLGIQATGMTALPSGDVFLAGTRCTVSADSSLAYRDAVVESWAPGQTRGKTRILPGLDKKDVEYADLYSIVASSSSDVFVAGRRAPKAPAGQETKQEAYLAHFDGQAWRAFSTPPIEQIQDLQRAPSGKLWALFEGQLWTTVGRVSEGVAWERVQMPRFTGEVGENSVSSFWVQDDEQVWATLASNDVSYLVRTKRGASPLSTPSDERVAQLSKAFDPTAASQCENPTLLLFTLSRQAPMDADMPSVRAALHGHTELEGKAQFIELPFLTRRYLGVRGELHTLLATQEILARANLPGVAPELRCLDTVPTRTLSMDFGSAKPDSRPKAAAR